jgi:hypothetical protein
VNTPPATATTLRVIPIAGDETLGILVLWTITIHEKLNAHEPVQSQYTEGSQEERGSASYPFQSVIAVVIGPAAPAVWGEIGPSVRVGEQGARVEQVPTERSHEEQWGKTLGALALIVLV